MQRARDSNEQLVVERFVLNNDASYALLSADTQSRVFLVDTRLFSVVRVWKGYRHTHCKFLSHSF